jgi:rare lipoprotein A
MIEKTWRCLLSALITTIPLAVVPFNAPAQADTNSKALSDSLISSTLKIGETRSQFLARPQGEAIAKIHSYKIDGKPAATVYVKNLPVLTFLSPTQIVPKVKYPTSKSLSKLPSRNDPQLESYISTDPLERATAIAALFNQLARNGFDENTIVPVWQSGFYSIQLGNEVSLRLDSSLMVLDSTKNKADDALITANLLRRLIGNAKPVTSIAGAPVVKVAKIRTSYSLPVAVVSQVVSGMASWYGPGFHGGYTANGERFNQYTLTAAHPNLPFGTPVRVTNTYNGRSVIVRINDRGPYSGGRVIDLSKGAAQVIGLVSSGVAPVRLEIMRR